MSQETSPRTCCDSSRIGTSNTVLGPLTSIRFLPSLARQRSAAASLRLRAATLLTGTAALLTGAPALSAPPPRAEITQPSTPKAAHPKPPPKIKKSSPDDKIDHHDEHDKKPVEANSAAPNSAEPVTRLKKVPVRASKLPPGEAEFETGASASVIEGEMLRRVAPDLTGVLARQVGLGVERIGGFGSTATVRIRGSAAQQVIWAIDDLPLRNVDGSSFDLGALPLSQLQRIEIYRSATPWQLGGQAIGGTVRLLLRRPNSPEMRGSVAAGSYGARRVEASGAWSALGSGMAAIRWLTSQGDWGYTWDGGTAFDGDDDERRTRQNNDLQRLSWMLRQSLELPKGWKLRLRYLGHLQERGLPGAALHEALYTRYRAQEHDAVLAAEGRGLISRRDHLLAQLHLGWQASAVSDPRGELGPPQDGERRTEGVGLSLRWRGETWGALRPALRIAGRLGRVQRWDTSRDLRAPPASREALEAGLALPASWSEGRWTLLPSLNLGWAASRRSAARIGGGWQTLDVAGRALPTWRLALRYQPLEALALQMGWTQANRVPTLAELFGNDGTISGHPALRDEQAQTADASLSWRQGWGPSEIQAELGVFASAVEDLIGLQRMQAHLARYENIAAARLLGAELSAQLTLPRRANLRAWYTSATARDDSGAPIYQDKALPMRPRTKLGLHVELHAHPLASLGRATLWGGWRWQSGHYTDRTNRVSLPPRSALDLGASVQSRGGRLELRLRADNVLDHENFDLLGFPLPGRTLMLTLTLNTRGRP